MENNWINKINYDESDMLDKKDQKFEKPLEIRNTNNKNEQQRLTFTCKVCGKTFDKEYNLQNHYKNHKTDLICNFCKKQFNNFDLLLKHSRDVHREILKQNLKFCQFCLRCFDDEQKKSKHLFEEHNQQPFCVLCKINFQDGDQYGRHFDTCKEKFKDVLICSICGKTGFNSQSPLNYHKRKMHTDHSDYPTCSICGKKFLYLNKLKAHIEQQHEKIKYECTTCGLKLTRESSLKAHQRVHTGETPYECEICKKRFKFLPVLRGHERMHRGERNHICHICQKSCLTSTQLKRHILTHSDERNFECSICSKRFYTYSELKTHQKFHFKVKKDDDKIDREEKIDKLLKTNKEFKKKIYCRVCIKKFATYNSLRKHSIKHKKLKICLFCNVTFESFDKLLEHTQDIHRDLFKEKPNFCPFCLKFCSKKLVMNKHISEEHPAQPHCFLCNISYMDSEMYGRHYLACKEKYKKEIICQICGKRDFNSISPMFYHKKKEHNVNCDYHTCEMCGKTFLFPNKLKAHIEQTHEQKKYECDLCGVKLTRQSTLQLHKRTMHNLNNSFKPYECDICHKKVRYQGSLTVHKKIHLNEKTHECKICLKKFLTSSRLKQHLMFHKGEKSYQCTICDYKSYTSGCMRRHELTHSKTKLKNVACSICDRTFFTHSGLKRHIKNHHLKDERN